MNKEFFLALDLETTGLDEGACVPLEIAVRLFRPGIIPIELDRYEAKIRPTPEELDAGEEYALNMHRESGLLEACRTGMTCAKAEYEVLSLIAKHCGKHRVYLLGNSVHFDRRFIRKHMPVLLERLHYRQLDVTSVALFQRLYGDVDPLNGFAKARAHLAQDDLEETVKELVVYARNLGLLEDESV